MSGTLQKPQLRGLLAGKLKFHLVGAITTSIAAGLLMKIFYADPRKRRYEEFYKTYDPVKQEKIMQDAGLLQSWPTWQKRD